MELLGLNNFLMSDLKQTSGYKILLQDDINDEGRAKVYFNSDLIASLETLEDAIFHFIIFTSLFTKTYAPVKTRCCLRAILFKRF